jgi:hypothetical protein
MSFAPEIKCFKGLPHFYKVTKGELMDADKYQMRQYVVRVIPMAYNVRVHLHNHYNHNMVSCHLYIDRPTGVSGRLEQYTLEAVHVYNVNGLYLQARQIALLRCWMKFLSKEDRI